MIPTEACLLQFRKSAQGTFLHAEGTAPSGVCACITVHCSTLLSFKRVKINQQPHKFKLASSSALLAFSSVGCAISVPVHVSIGRPAWDILLRPVHPVHDKPAMHTSGLLDVFQQEQCFCIQAQMFDGFLKACDRSRPPNCNVHTFV